MFTYIDLIILASSVFLIIIVKLLTGEARSPIFNVYQRPTKIYWFKVVFMYSVLKFRQIANYLKSERRRDLGKVDKYILQDGPQPLKDSELAVDAVFFNGANSKGDYFIIATARRSNKLVDGFIYLKINDSKLGLLESPKLPSTALYQLEETQEYKAEGIEISVIEPMKIWKIKYNGKMKSADNRSKWYNVKIVGEFVSKLPPYNVDVDMDPFMMAKALAVEPWSRDFFRTLNETHQMHYEQFGDMLTEVEIDGKPFNLKINVCRDHSFASKREWRIFHRYALHFITVENGDRIMIGVVSMPVAISCFSMGFVYSSIEQKMYPIENCDLVLHQHGENGEAPFDYGFSIYAGHKSYVIKVHVKESPHFYISKDWEAKLFERLCTFKVNGLKGWGGSEWMYRNIEGKHVLDYEKNKEFF
ncbi:uncharacterized protein [Onthophagus taurus]|uniref:uncharacterized protein n=1 Tax=Onthophagus taurus TaxID=166361 RepID=UPI0039BDBEC6